MPSVPSPSSAEGVKAALGEKRGSFEGWEAAENSPMVLGAGLPEPGSSG